MMKLAATVFVSVDGVMQSPGAPEEDRRGGFELGGWTTPLWDDEAGAVLSETYERAEAFLFGRRTFEAFADSWGKVDDPSINPIATALHARPKYVASNTLTDPAWSNTTVLSGDLLPAVQQLKESSEGELLVNGCGALTRWLLDNELVDELSLFIFPAVLGQGTRLFPENGRDSAVELVSSQTTPKGVTIQVYRPTGRVQVGTSTADLKHVEHVDHVDD